ncbi:MAG TPA: FAD-dependent monooxygenase [Geminicoccus sp.]|uniref:NAD(P)/FAD-dependent oxidoreductase n=1 Tax=Geminicoccus sp. TaxID=2024832 RepID=UPI002CA4ACBE|nr:FAD-dependent monooxygenase [Geminicoccus sp.]HWL68401.1 FAD-dependent monooxygenase [Geminicoccus sp.]
MVVGSGIAGLAAAQALADHFDLVLILERDAEPLDGQPRPGVPQGRHPHLLLCGGMNALSTLFPGLVQDLHAAGAVPLDVGRDLQLELPEVGALPRRELGLATFSMTRPLLEQALRRRVTHRGNVEIRYRTRVIGILNAPSDGRVTGVHYQEGLGRYGMTGADLVVDASGWASPTLDWLETNGMTLRQTVVGVDIGYSSAVFAPPTAPDADFVGAATFADAPGSSRSGYVLQAENGSWQVLLVGRGDDRPPTDPRQFIAYAQGLLTPTIADFLARVGPPPHVSCFAFPKSVWRHFRGATRLPRGLLPIGDAICRFNPVYGQGMSVAAQEAVLLRDLLERQAGSADPLATLTDQFLAGAERFIETPWAVSTLPDFVYPQTKGERPARLEEELQQQAALRRQALVDPDACRLLSEVHHLLKPLQALRTAGLVAA